MKKINQSTFDKKVRDSEALHLIVFSATWCRPCNLMTPILEEAEKKHSDVGFVKIDIEAEPDLADEFEVTSIPTLVLYEDGSIVGKKVGMVSKKDLDEWLTDNQ